LLLPFSFWPNFGRWPGAQKSSEAAAPAAAKAAKPADDDVDLFADDDDDAAKEAEISRRAKELAEKKKAAGKAPLVMKSAVLIDVKPWDDETDMKMLEEKVREIVLDGLEWKAGKLLPIGYGIKKLQILAHVEDDKVSVDDIQEKIQELEDLVQSTDIASFSKL
jgi:elongation factor 1-beta